MKKIIMAVLIGVVATSYGVINVNWVASGGFYYSADPMTGILGADNSGYSTIAQLLYSPDNVRDDLWNNVVNDTVLSTYTITAEGSLFSGYAVFPETSNYQAPFMAGWVYAIIYNKAVGATNYYYTPTLALEDVVDVGLPQGIQMNWDLNFGNAIDDPNVNPTLDPTAYGTWAIPEPSTALLLGTGGLVVWFGRRKLNRDPGTKVAPKKMQKVNLLHR